ncbi:MAG: sigma-54-dependent transcriptional regulator [Planctomycetota bacterium]|jgi:DNA-binding NtrC family response regulator
MDTILVIDDDESMQDLLSELLAGDDRLILKAGSAMRGLEILNNENVDLILSDINMPDVNGIELIRMAQERHITAPIITITAYASTETAVEALRAGAYDYLSKPFAHEELLKLVENTLKAEHLFQEVTYLRGKLDRQYSLENIIGQCPSMQQIFEIIERISNAHCNVLITGQSGTGKEVVARAIHNQSTRKDHPFIPINCASIPENLLESELFGHVKGAFTGAIQDKSGLIEEAHTGTLFLDEIGDMPILLQAKLLRVLQDRKVQKVGSTTSNTVDIRVIAATNQMLREKIVHNTFRKDLYYRLNVVELKLPPLRERGNDINLLACHFLKRYSERLSKPMQGFSPATRKAFKGYTWPGNVRELENAIEHAVTLCQADTVDIIDLPGDIQCYSESLDLVNGTLDDRVCRFESQCIEKTLNKLNHDFHLAADELGVSLATLYRKAKKYKLPLKTRIVEIPAQKQMKSENQKALFDYV